MEDKTLTFPQHRPTGREVPGGDRALRAAWAAAWLREYQCHTHYLSLLDRDEVGELELRFAWLDWWDASCVCRAAAERLEAFRSPPGVARDYPTAP